MKSELNDITKLAGIGTINENFHNLDQFTQSYLTTAFWSEMDDDGQPLEKNYDIHDLATSTMNKVIQECTEFQNQAGDMLMESGWKLAGHDFWLTRNGHGAGFWDGDWPENGDALTSLSKKFGEADWYVGDDGKIYQYGSEISENKVKSFGDYLKEAYQDEYQTRKEERREKYHVPMADSLRQSLKQAKKQRNATAMVYYTDMIKLHDDGKLSACADADTFLNSWAGHQWFKKNRGRIEQAAEEFTNDTSRFGAGKQKFNVVAPRSLKEYYEQPGDLNQSKFIADASPKRAGEIRAMLANFKAAHKGEITSQEFPDGPRVIFKILGPEPLVKKIRIGINTILSESN